MESRSLAGEPRPPLLLHLPDHILREVALHLDTPTLHNLNWRALVSLIPQYTHTNITVLTIEEQRGRSPGMALIRDLHSRGWSAVDFAQLAARAQMGAVTDIIREHCHKVGITLPALDQPLPTGPRHYPVSAPTCFDRPSTPPSPPPPQATPSGQATVTAEPVAPQSSLEVPYTTLYEGTSHFSKLPYKEGGNMLGEGGFGEVFWCRLTVGGTEMETAVKVLNKVDGSGSLSLNKQQFVTEQESLLLPPHECLLPLLGYSADGPALCLLYPFMPRGSLDKHLADFQTLTPTMRVGVACDVCKALEVLHTGADRVVVHRDVKSANILLTETWRAKLGDFGVVRFLPSSQTMHTSTIVGTLVYMAPEYAKGIVSPAADIYGLGVVLYELLLGRSAQEDVEGTDLLSYVEECEDNPSSDLIGQWPQGVWQEVWSLAGQCVEHNRKKRPTATELVHRLHVLQQSP